MKSIGVMLVLKFFFSFFWNKIEVNVIRIVIPEGMINFKIRLRWSELSFLWYCHDTLEKASIF